MLGAPLALVKLVGFFLGGIQCSVACVGYARIRIRSARRIRQAVTGTSLHRNETIARAKLEKLGLHPVKLSVREETPRNPMNKFWDGTFFDTVMWLLVLCIPIAGLFSPTPDVGFLSGVVLVLLLGAARVFSGNWHSGNH